MNSHRIHKPALVVFALAAIPLASAQNAGTVLFAPPGVQIIDNTGLFRDAKKGDVLKPGERLLTPPNTISQVKLPDGGLVGMRPGSVLKFDAPPPGSAQAQQVISLVQGTVRVVGGELAGQIKAAPVALQTGQAILQVKGADVESAVVRPDTSANASNAPKAADANNPGSYSRLLAGSGTIKSGTSDQALQKGQVSFVSQTNPVPTALANVAPTVFAPSSSREGVAPIRPGQAAIAPQPPSSPGSVTRATSTLTAPPPSGQGGLPIGTGAGAGVRPPLFSPITTGQFPAAQGQTGGQTALQPGGQTANQPRPPGTPGPIAGGPSPAVRMPPPPPPRPPVILQPPRPPICRPSTVPGQPPICS